MNVDETAFLFIGFASSSNWLNHCHFLYPFLLIYRYNVTWGPLAGYNFIDKLTEDIWEITPGVNRVLLFLWDGNKYVLLSYFRKTTAKTPRREIKKAEQRRKDWLERYSKEG